MFASDDAVSTFVNAKMTFTPASYKQMVKVDATAIGAGSRPVSAEARIAYWEAPAYGEPTTISQHLVYPYGLSIPLTSGEGTNDESVWNLKWNNKVYQYQAVLTKVGSTAYDSNNPYYTVTYSPIQSYQDAAGTPLISKNPLTITLTPKTYDITFVMNDSKLANVTQADKHMWSYQTTIDIAEPVRENYVFMGWYDNPRLTGNPVTRIAADVHEDITLYAKWELDVMVNNTEVGGDLNGSARGDGVPDIYQARVIFDVVNGTWKETGTKGTLERIYTLKGKNDANGLWTVDKAPKLGTLPETMPDATHTESSGGWNVAIDADTAVPAGGAHYVYTYHQANEYTLSVTVENGSAKMDGVRYTNTTATKLVSAVPAGATTKVEFEPALRHMLESVTVDGVSEDLVSNNYYTLDHTKSHVIHVVYTEDAIGESGVPDKYEKRIVFKVEGGTWAGGATEIEEYVTLKDGGGNWSLSGTASLSGIIPNTAAAAAAAGYKAGTGKWIGTAPTAEIEVSGTDTVTYTYAFSRPQYVEYSYTERHFRQLPNGSYAEADVEVVTLPNPLELNAAGTAFEETPPAVTISLKDYGSHFVVDDNHPDRVLSGTPEYGEALTLKRYYALGEHTLQYMNGATPVGEVITKRCGTDLEVAAGPSVSGLVFTGWKEKDSGTIYLPGDSLILDHNVILLAQWTNAPVNYTVKYAEEGTNLPLGERTFVGEVSQVITDISYPATLTHAGTAYVYAYTADLPLTLGVTAADNVVTVYYDTDAQNDGVADMYQKKVTFKVVNGKWSNGTTADIVQYLPLVDGSGQYSLSGSATLTPPVGMKANSGYEGGTWNVTPLPAAVSGVEDVVYTYTFQRTSGGGGGAGGSGGNTGGAGASDKLNTIDHFSYIVGFKDDELKPYNSITRGQVATIFFRLLTDEARAQYWSQTNNYSDCGENLWCNNAISTLSNMGVIDGYLDGTFRPNAPITRAQFAKIAVGFFETTMKEYEGRYSDVSKSAWYSEYVEAASRVGLIQGFADGTYRPNVNITRAQACVIVNRALGRKPDAAHMLPEKEMLVWKDNTPNDWFYADMLEATNSHGYTWLEVSGKTVEQWTEKLPQRDWTALEHSWSTAHSAPGGDVATGE